jgi:hypothetical protein
MALALGTVVGHGQLYSGISNNKTFYYNVLTTSSGRFNRPARRGYFPHDSRHFVPGYYRAVPPGQKPFAHRIASYYLSAYGVTLAYDILALQAA